MQIFELLKKDHDHVKELFGQIKNKKMPAGKSQDSIFSEIHDELMAHMEGEEKLFYPAIQQDKNVREMVFEGIEEHNISKVVLKELFNMSQDDERWNAKLTVLEELIDHHIEEEERELFVKASKIINKEKGQEMAMRFAEEKQRHISPGNA